MSIRWDPLLVRHLAVELNAALAGARVRALRMDGETRDLALLLQDRTLHWALHPQKGWPRLAAPVEPRDADFKLRTRVIGVESPDDERIVRLSFAPVDGRPLQLVIELLGNQWNAMLVEGDAPPVIRHVLVRRHGARVQRVGEPYRAPRPLVRSGIHGEVSEAEWIGALSTVPDGERARVLVQRFAWISSLNVHALLGTGGYALWRQFADARLPPHPILLDLASGPQPYPFPLTGTPSRRVENLLAAFEACAVASDPERAPAAPTLDPALLEQLEGAVRREIGRAHV